MPPWLKDGDVYASLALIALGSLILYEAAPWDFYSPDGPGPAMFPRMYGVGMIGLSLLLLASKLSGGAAKADPDAKPIDWAGTRRAVGAFAGFAAAVLSMGHLGFTIPFALFTFFLVMFVWRRPVLTALATAVALPAVFYVTFPLLLGVQLPTGIIGF